MIYEYPYPEPDPGAGLGGMKPNTVILGWPSTWRRLDRSEDLGVTWRIFVDTIRNTAAAKMALLVPKGIDCYPDSSSEKLKNCIDIWWIVNDGGLMLLLPFLLVSASAQMIKLQN